MLLVVLAASLVAVNAVPLGIDTQNVVTVPPNCPTGQEWINGQCRDVWTETSNVVVVPPNCPAGQELINGVCRDVWRQRSLDLNRLAPEPYSINSDLLAAIENALEGRLPRKEKRQADHEKGEIQPEQSEQVLQVFNIISVPSQCPNGSRPDGLGICRPIFD